MKPFTLMCEFDHTVYPDSYPWWKPGYFRGNFKNGYFKRVWWFCFSIALVRMPLWEYNDHLRKGKTEWKKGSAA